MFYKIKELKYTAENESISATIFTIASLNLANEPLNLKLGKRPPSKNSSLVSVN